MQIEELARATAGAAMDGIKAFAQLERVLAAVCALSPLLMIWFDTWTVRESISAYYDMTDAAAFYVPLTVAAMLFVVNGVVKHRHGYNWMLGVALFGVIMLNHTAFAWPHRVAASLFFGGNVVVIALARTKPVFKVAILGAAGILFLASLGLDGWKLFWLEWVSLGVIATNYVLDSLQDVEYQAPQAEGADKKASVAELA
ncbi:MAG TPA: hypothetical protein VFY15_07330 [Acidimicrobiia bacterium]|nr:hypothetical protein [Acidimicrobiia bacterium]